MLRKGQAWLNKVVNLVEIAKSEPHAAFAAFTGSYSSQVLYFVYQLIVSGEAGSKGHISMSGF